MSRVFLLIVLVCGSLAGSCVPILATEQTSIALTTTSESHHHLSDALIELLETQILADGSISVVERRQIELAMQELALSKTRSGEESLQLGKLISADIIVMLELRKPDERSDKPTALLRIVDSKTAAIRGISVATNIDEPSLDEVVQQFARSVSKVIHQPELPTVTVAVAPFESVGRFDRLRPLELGIRDLVTMRLMSSAIPSADDVTGLGDTSLPTEAPTTTPQTRLSQPTEPRSPSEQQPLATVHKLSAVARGNDVNHPFVQVLQRQNLDQLLREMDLIQSGFVDKDHLPQTMPDRQAAFLIKGEIDERQIDGKLAIVVRGQLVHAATAKVRDSFEFITLPAELPLRLAASVDQFIVKLGMSAQVKRTDRERLANREKDVASRSDHIKQISFEASSLKRLALQDLHRFRRLSPIDFGHRPFRLPGDDASHGVSRLATPDTPLGQALIRKSIDRLESVLFIHPDDLEAAYGLGFCYSLHEHGFYLPNRADDFLRKVATSKPQSELAALSLSFLGEIAFHDRTGQLDREQRDATANRLWTAFEEMPEKYRDHRWPRILSLIQSTDRSTTELAELLRKLAPFVEQTGKDQRHQLASQVQQLALRLALRAKDEPVAQAEATDLLHHWAEGSDQTLADLGRQGLAAISAGEKNYLMAALQYEESARKLGDAKSILDRHKHDLHLISAAGNYRLAQQPENALRLLKSFKPLHRVSSTLTGLHGYEIGACFEALGDKERARAAFLDATEECPSIVTNSDIVQRIATLGGVPLNEDREIDVSYFTTSANQPVVATHLATDGKKLFIGGTGVSAVTADSHEVVSQTGTLQNRDIGKVSAMKLANGRLWVGTDGNGLWCHDLVTREWTRFGSEQGLPDLRVTTIAPHRNKIYVGVGNLSSGGLIQIDDAGAISLFDDPDAPHVAPTHIVVDDKRLLARTPETIHEQSFERGAWTIHKADPTRRPIISPRLFAGTSNVWASNYGRELSNWDADAATNQLFQPSWFHGQGKAGYLVTFVTERNTDGHDEIWFGGQPWDHFVTSGLYRFDRKSKAFHKFSPRDGFKAVRTQNVTDGVWIRNRLWLATSQGLCFVTPRNEMRFPVNGQRTMTKDLP